MHSERASATRFKMILQDPATLSEINVIKQAGLTTWVYTNDANVNLTYDIKSSQIVTAAASPPTSVAVQEVASDKPATPAPSATVCAANRVRQACTDHYPCRGCAGSRRG